MKTMRTALHAALVLDGRTAVQIAAEAGINAVTLSLLRNGRRTARLETALKLSRALGKTP